ncbi:hypothetical protein D3C77_329090 [compost metagenome]
MLEGSQSQLPYLLKIFTNRQLRQRLAAQSQRIGKHTDDRLVLHSSPACKRRSHNNVMLTGIFGEKHVVGRHHDHKDRRLTGGSSSLDLLRQFNFQLLHQPLPRKAANRRTGLIRLKFQKRQFSAEARQPILLALRICFVIPLLLLVSKILILNSQRWQRDVLIQLDKLSHPYFY